MARTKAMLGERGAAHGLFEYEFISACVPGVPDRRTLGGAPLQQSSHAQLSGHGRRVLLHGLEPVPRSRLRRRV